MSSKEEAIPFIVAVHDVSDPDRVDAVREIVDTGAGDSSRNEYFAVDPQHPGARGVPAQAATAG